LSFLPKAFGIGNLSEPLFGKEGIGEISWIINLLKKSPFAKRGCYKRGCRTSRHDKKTTKNLNNFFRTSCIYIINVLINLGIGAALIWVRTSVSV